MMNRINLQLVAMGRQVSRGRVLILMLNIIAFMTLILSSSDLLISLIIFSSLILLNGHFIVFGTTKEAHGLQELDLWIVGLTLFAGYMRLMFGI
ncbi:hypothetical protein [Secundilactobacillus folii]|uniref:Uncharacterized protein n=1 Tax=Secundilactobacillus folii TaxID=2678357 RepID=A0A7X2XUR4_9LACO|nr:hypothetical protein [Secundilactobacillus folii]MTV82042.1 hypothetical protein [Secundilactobacillus folii]